MGYSVVTGHVFILILKCFFILFLNYSHLVFEEPEDPSNRSFFSEIISSISDVKFSHSGRYLMTRDYLTVKVWDLNMESKPLETYQVRHLISLHLTKYWLMPNLKDPMMSNLAFLAFNPCLVALRSSICLYAPKKRQIKSFSIHKHLKFTVRKTDQKWCLIFNYTNVAQ